MAEQPMRPVTGMPTNASQKSKQTAIPGASSAETARAADSVPVAVGAFAAGRFSQLPMRFGRYEIRRELGRGQMGAVYLAQDLELDRPIALKVARVSASGSARLLQRMQVEAKAAARIDHPLICKVYDAGEIDDIRFIALQYVEGEDLKKYMKRVGRRVEPDEAIRLVMLILGALEAAHEKGIIHRDLKPENIMLNKNNEPVIMDFGLARSRVASPDAGLTQGMIVGTAAYMPPEQATGKADAIDHRCDLYAVGVILFELLTGDWPFNGAAIEVMGKKCVQEPPSPLDLNPTLNPQLAAICVKMIARKKEDRFGTCAEAVAALEKSKLSVANVIGSDATLDEYETVFNFEKTSETPPVLRKSSRDIDTPKNTAARKISSSKSSLATTKKSLTGRNTKAALWIATSIGCAAAIGVLLTMALFPQGQSAPRKQEKNPSYAKTSIPTEAAVKIQAPNMDKTVSEANNSIVVPPNKPMEVAAINPPEPRFSRSLQSPDATGLVQTENAIEPESEPESPSILDAKNDPEPPSMSVVDDAMPEANTGIRSSSDLDQLIRTAGRQIEASITAKGKDGFAIFKDAVSTLKKASNINSKDLRGDFYLGLLHSGVGVKDPKTAEFHFKRVLDRSPGHIAAMNNLALVSINADKFNQSRVNLERASKVSPRPIEVNQNIGRLNSQAKLLEIKREDLKQIIKIIPEPGTFRSEIGWMYMPLDNTPNSQNEYKLFCRDGSLEDPSCSICKGFASLPCKTCGKDGAVVVMGSMAGSASSPFGTANYSAPTAATLRCGTCGGRGRVDCPGCLNGHDPSLRKH